ncbi:MAG TPA: hypothetical protein VH369_17475, partial [Bryobacteraceae bacterium]
LGKGYQPAFMQFLGEAAARHPSAECLEKLYGKNPAQVMKELQRYVHQSSVQAAIYNVKLKSADLEPEVADAAPLQVDLALADLLASNKNTAAEAGARLARLAAAYPANADVEESLGYLAWQQGDTAKAKESFARAIEKGSRNPEMMLHDAQLLNASGTPPEQTIPVLEKAAKLKPADRDIWFLLGITEMNARQWGAALVALSHVDRVAPERAFPLFSALAYCDVQLRSFEQALAMATKAKQYAANPEQITQISNLLDYLDSVERSRPAVAPEESRSSAPPAGVPHEVPADRPLLVRTKNLQHVEAVAKSFECGGKTPRLHVIAGGREMTFELTDPTGIVVRNAPGGHFDFSCGMQKAFHVGVFYEPAPEGRKIDGTIRELAF